MLTHLVIHNLAVLQHLDISFQAGMSIFTGETGAGKSILMDALGLILGERAETNLIRPGEKMAEVSAFFEIGHLPWVQAFLKERELLNQPECMIRRTLTDEGRSRAYINGHPVPIQYLKELGEGLITLHGQHQNHALLKTSYQLSLLDAYADHSPLLHDVQELYQALHAAQKEQAKLMALQSENDKLALLEYQLQELEELGLLPGQLQQLENEHKTLSHADQWSLDCDSILSSLEEDNAHNILSLLHQHIHKLKLLNCDKPQIKNSLELFNQALIALEEAVIELKSFQAEIAQDPERLNFVQEKLTQIFNLARKHRVSPEQLSEHQAHLLEQAEQLKNSESRLKELDTQIQHLKEKYLTAAKKLTQSRQVAAHTLSEKILGRLHYLEMPHAQFDIQFLESDLMNESGVDQIEYRVSLNPGHPLQPLRKIASGGELSRISLAIQVITAEKMTIPTLIFDEVDVGVGGKTAEIIGKLLRSLSNNTQVLCITHLAQVAAQGHHHYKVLKLQSTSHTKTNIVYLENQEKVNELARMLGGIQITENTIKHAKEMLDMA